MTYIEAEMARRTGGADASSSLDEAALLKAVNNPEDELYAVAEKYKELQRSIKPEQTQDEREGNVALSAAMLSSIPEVDLGIDTRMKNIEQTERPKREFYEKRKAPGAAGGDADEAYANARCKCTQLTTAFMLSVIGTDNLFMSHTVMRTSQAPHRGGFSTHSSNRAERKEMATDQLVLDRFKKRQRNFR